MKYAKISCCHIANGIGVGVVLWCQGCRMHCRGCHNQSTWNFDSGTDFTSSEKEFILKELSKPWISRLTLSGGHPLEPENYDIIFDLCKTVKEQLPTKAIWLYTGLRYEDIANDHILNYIDVLVDGRYVEEQRDISLKFRGSSNQRIIDVKKTIAADEICLWEG